MPAPGVTSSPLDALNRIAGRPLVRTLLLLCALLGVYLQAHTFFLSESHEVDSYSYWFAAEAVRDGGDPYDLKLLQELGRAHDLRLVAGDTRAPEIYPYVYPPPFAGVWRVFLAWPPTRVHRLLEVLGTLLLGVALFAIHRLVRPRRHGALLFALFAVTLAVNGPAVSSTRLGQINAGILAAMGFAALRRRDGHDRSSALALAGATLVKLTPGLLLLGFGSGSGFVFGDRRWRGYVLKFTLALGALVLVTLPLAPPATWVHFWNALRHGLPWQTEYSLWGWLTLHGAQHPALAAGRVPIYALGWTVLIACTWRHLRRVDDTDRVLEGTACTIVLGLLLSPLTWQHHFLFFMLPGYVWIARAWSTERTFTALALAGLTAVVLLRLPGGVLVVRPIATLLAFAIATLGPYGERGATSAPGLAPSMPAPR